MSLRDEVVALSVRPGPMCPVALIGPELQAEVEEILASPGPSVQLAALNKALRARGLDVSAAALGKHRREVCACH